MTGLYGKYSVIKNETGEEVQNCFVLRPDRDYDALVAMFVYVNLIRNSNSELAGDLMDWLVPFSLKFKEQATAEVESESAQTTEDQLLENQEHLEQPQPKRPVSKKRKPKS